MTEIQHPNMFAAYQQGHAFGNQIKQQRAAEQELAQLRGLAPGIMQGDPNALAAAGAINPKAAGDYDAIGVDIAKRATGAATFLMEAVKRGNPQEIEGRYRQVKPFLDKVAQTAGKPPAPDTFDPAMVPLMEQLIARSQGMGGEAGTGVQSTYVDAQGNRVAILRDGSTQILGQNAQNNQIIDTGAGFYGVNKGNLSAAPVVVGGAPQPVAQPQVGPPSGQPFTIDPSLPPEVQQAIRSNEQAWATAPDDSSVQLPPVNRGQQLTSAPKPQATPAGYRVLPDGTMEAIAGGPAQVAIDARNDAAAARRAADEAKALQKQQGVQARQVEAASAANQLVSAIDNLMTAPGFDDLGTPLGDVQLKIPLVRNDVKDAQAQLKNIAGQVAMTTMARLKALSSSGATGFGSLTAPELRLLENSIATLQADEISNAQLMTSLKTIRDTMDKTTQWQPQQASGDADGDGVDDLLQKYGVQ